VVPDTFWIFPEWSTKIILEEFDGRIGIIDQQVQPTLFFFNLVENFGKALPPRTSI
jgi:hypothetical protein